jgi:L-lactate dehydrogenase complex protein LldG
MNEADFLAHIARRLGRTEPMTKAPARDAVGAPEFWSEYSLPLEERIVRFQQELENLGGKVEVYDTLEQLRAGLADLLRQLAPSRIGTWGGDTLAEFGVDEVLEPFEVLRWGEQPVEAFASVDVGITGCSYAVADTGTLVMKCDPFRGRSVTVLPSVHVALVHAHQIRTRLGEVLEELASERDHMASYVHFITGPSRSSDIENDQTIGIHGPAAVYALVVKD